MFKKLSLASLIIASCAFGTVATAPQAEAAEQQKSAASKKKTRRTPALRARVYEQLARAQKLADEGSVAEGLEVLDKVQSRSSSMNSYEKAMMWNFYGFIYYNQKDNAKAASYFEKLIAEDNIPESLEKSTLFSLAQLYMMDGKFDTTINYLNRWETLHEGEIPASHYMLKAQAFYQDKNYQQVLVNVNKAVSIEEQSGKVAKENWLILQRAAYYELKQPEKVTQILEKLVRLYNKAEYWVQLGGMYGEIGEEAKQLAVMEAAYQQGYVTKKTQIKSLAQLYFYHEVPVKAAELMQDAIATKKLVVDEKNLQFLAQAWVAAKNNDKALPVLMQASKLATHGNFEQRIGEIYLNLDKHQEAIDFIAKAVEKGQLDNPGNAHLALGIAHYNLGHYDNAIARFAEATDVKEAAKSAQQWLAYVKREQKNQKQLNASLDDSE